MKQVRFRHSVIDPEPAGSHQDITLLFDVNGNGFNDIVIGAFRDRIRLAAPITPPTVGEVPRS